MKKTLVGLVMLFSASLSSAFELLEDGSMGLLPQEIVVLESCRKAGGSGCFIVNREVLERFGQQYAASQIEQLQAEVRERFDKAVADEAKSVAKQICKNSI